MKKIFLIAFATFLSVGSYAAEDNVVDKKPLGVYVGGGFGAKVSNSTDYSNGIVPDVDLFPSSKSDINLFVGYNIMKYLAVELELNYGLKSTKKDSKTFDEKIPAVGNVTAYGNLKQTYNNQSFLLNVVGKYPILEKHIPFIKLGIGSMMYENKYKTNASASLNNELIGSYNSSDNIEGTGLAYKLAVGYEYAITQKHSVILAFNYNMVPSLDVKDSLSENFVPNPSLLPDASPINDSYKEKVNNVAKTTYSTINISYKFTF